MDVRVQQHGQQGQHGKQRPGAVSDGEHDDLGEGALRRGHEAHPVFEKRIVVWKSMFRLKFINLD